MNTVKQEWEQQWHTPWTGLDHLATLLALGLAAALVAWL
jgi:hydrogenase/urease accessory protein HupE